MKKILVMMLGLSLLTGCGCDKEKTKNEVDKNTLKENVQHDVIKDQEVEMFKFTNTSLTYYNGTSVLVTEVKNTSAEPQYLDAFKIHVWDKDGNEIITLRGFVGSNIQSGETRTINTSYGSDLTGVAASITYEIVR